MKNSMRAMVSPIIGTVIEAYDILLYVHLLPILIPLFFPDESMFSSRIIATMTISATLIMRPLGAIYFGYIGDKKGRKRGLSSAIIFMIAPTFVISILPTYSQIYLWAPVVLILCRLVQGFSMGGETGGAHTSLVEFSEKNYISTIGSFVYVSITLGSLLATLVAYFVNMNILDWRLAFFIGALLSLVGFYIRYQMYETPQFVDCLSKNEISESPLYDLIKTNKRELLHSFLMSFGAVIPFHLNYVYMVDFLKNTLMFPLTRISLINVSTQILAIILMPIFGFFGDKFKKELFMIASLIILLFIVYPSILYNNARPSVISSIIIQVLLSICASIYAGGFFASVALMFPVNRRFTASGISVSLGIAIFSFVPSLFIFGSNQKELFMYTFFFMFLFGCLNIIVIAPRRKDKPNEYAQFQEGRA